jgi:hypothetical protein
MAAAGPNAQAATKKMDRTEDGFLPQGINLLRRSRDQDTKTDQTEDGFRPQGVNCFLFVRDHVLAPT